MKNKKRIFIIAGISIALILSGSVAAIHLLIGHTVDKNIEIAQQKYSGTPEDALIAFLEDEGNSAKDRTHVAIWTLGQIRSKKALPVLNKLYKNDPEGKTCYEKHDSALCQYEIYKAIKSIENSEE